MIIPPDTQDSARWTHTRLRRRLGDDLWEQDVADRLSARLTPGRVVNLGRPVTGLNLYQSTISQLAVQYDQAPAVGNPALEDEATAAVWSVVQEDTHIWELAQTNAESVIGLRECLVKLNRTPRGVRLSLAYPDTVIIETDPCDPDHITKISEAGIYTIEGKPEECWTIWDISDPEKPTRTIRTASEGKDVSSIADPSYEGWQDFYEDGTAYLPFVRYRAKWSPRQWCAYDWSTLVEAALDVAILWTCWQKWVLDASWAQRYVVDLVLQGLTVTGSGAGATASVDADPPSILCFKTIGEKPGTAGQFSPPGNPKELADSIMVYQASVLSNLGIHPTDLESTSQPSSGTAIQLKRSAQRRLARKFIPQFRSGDQELLKKIAATHNGLAIPGTPALPEDGWTIDYHLPESTPDEVAAELDQDLRLIDAGLASKVDIYVKMHPDLDRARALQALIDIQKESMALSAPVTTSDPQGD